MRAERFDAIALNVASTAATASGRSARGPLGCQSSASGAVNVRYTQKHGSVPSSVPSTSASTNRGSDARLIVARASARGAAAARGRVKRRIGHLSVVERGLRRSAAARAWVLIAATWRGDGVASALACGHALLGSGGGSIDDSVGADCAADALLGGSCRARHLTAGAGFVRRRPRRRRRAWLGSQRQRERSVSKRCFRARAAARQACAQGCQSLFCRGTRPNQALPVEFANITWYPLRYEKK